MLLLWLILSFANDTVTARLEAASTAYRNGKYVEAVERFDALEQADILRDTYACFAYATSLQFVKRLDEALFFYDALPAEFTRYDMVYYNRACIASSRGDQSKALEYLIRAYRNGFKNTELVKKDSDLALLRKQPGFFVVPQSERVEVQLADGSHQAVDLAQPLHGRPAKHLLIAFASGNQHPRARRHAAATLWGYGLQEQDWRIVEVGQPEVSWFSPLGKQRLQNLMDRLIEDYGLPSGYHVAGNLDGGSVAILAAALATKKATSLALTPGVPRPDFEDKLYAALKATRVRLVYYPDFPRWWHQKIDQLHANLDSAGVSFKRFEFEHYFFNFVRLRRGGLGPFLTGEMDDDDL